MRVSWQLTGVRDDPMARDEPLAVEVTEEGDDRGRYLYPRGYGRPESEGTVVGPRSGKKVVRRERRGSGG